jgi:hypothetical protein
MVGWKRGRPVYPPAGWVSAVSAAEADAVGYARVESEDHPLGGYWFPVSEEPEDPDEFVEGREDIKDHHLIQYPSEDRSPELGDGEDAPPEVNDRHVDATLSTPEDVEFPGGDA